MKAFGMGMLATVVLGTAPMMARNIVSFSSHTAGYDPNSDRYLCRAQTVYKPGYFLAATMGIFVNMAIQNNLTNYKQQIKQNDTGVWNHVFQDAKAFALAINPTIVLPKWCDTITMEYTMQRLPSGRIVTAPLTRQCGQWDGGPPNQRRHQAASGQ
jgi:hypothetical protein